MVYGIYMVNGIWYIVHCTLYIVYGIGYMVYGLWYFNVYCMVWYYDGIAFYRMVLHCIA